MKPLYEITGDLGQIQAMVDEGVPLDQLSDTLELINSDFDSKVEACVMVIENQLAYADALKYQERAFSERRKAAETQADNLKRYVKDCMARAGKDKAGKIKTATLTKPRKVLSIINEDGLPQKYREQVISYQIDKKAIEQALKDGIEISGAELIDSDFGLRIK